MSTSQSRSHYSEPTTAERNWPLEQIELARGLVARYTGMIGWPENQIDELERALGEWSRDSAQTRPAPAEVARACGAALGAHVARRVGLKWMVREDPTARTMVLWGRSASGTDVVEDPVGLVTKRLGDGMLEFLVELENVLCEDLADAMAR